MAGPQVGPYRGRQPRGCLSLRRLVALLPRRTKAWLARWF